MFKLALHIFALCALLALSASASPALSSLPLEMRSTASDIGGSDVFQSCVRRYNTSRMNPLPREGYFDPNNGTVNGSMITVWLSPTPGEPINAIISSNSSPEVLCPEGFLRYATSINFGVSCLGNVNGSEQYANLGDGFGLRSQGNYGGGNGVLRWNYGDPTFGTCKESIEGDNHFRWFLQNGSDAFTGAIFIAASMEESAALGHMIQTDGYNRGRDYIVGNATMNSTTSYRGYTWKTTVEWIPAGVLLNATSEGINHPEVALPGQPVQDGRVALLTVTQLETPASRTATSASKTAHPLMISAVASIVVVALASLLLL